MKLTTLTDNFGTLDASARYSVAGYDGIAFYLRGFLTETVQPECEGHPAEDCGEDGLYCSIGDVLYCDGSCNSPEEIVNESLVVAVMVGDDREHIVDVSDLTILADEDYCHECGQIGCGHDGIER